MTTTTTTITTMITGYTEFEGELFFNTEFDENGDHFADVLTEQELVQQILKDGSKFEYDAEYDELVETLLPIIKSTKYVELDSFADGGKEHDIYLHQAYMEEGEIKFDKCGKLHKTYKNLKSAEKEVAWLTAS